MKNLPIKERIEKLLQKEYPYCNVWHVKGKPLYLKSTSKPNGWGSPVEIPVNTRNSYEKVLKCAKVYKKLIQEDFYHPETQIIVYKTDEDNLALMVVMPELKVEEDYLEDLEKLIRKRIRNMKKSLNLKERLARDMYLTFNWGYDKKTQEIYAHDLHLVDTRFSYQKPLYKKILGIAKQMRIR